MALTTSNATLIYSRTSINTNGGSDWTASGSGTNEYYRTLPSNSVEEFLVPYEDGTALSEGTLGSLSVSEYGIGDNDTLGSNHLYVRLSDGADPDSKATGYVTADVPKEIFSVTTDHRFDVTSYKLNNRSGSIASIRLIHKNSSSVVTYIEDILSAPTYDPILCDTKENFMSEETYWIVANQEDVYIIVTYGDVS